MECLAEHYLEDFSNIKGDVFEVFTQFSKLDMSYIHIWLEKQFEQNIVKNDIISNEHRLKGNDFFAKKDLTKAIESYTKSICFATAESSEYAVSLANRSAVAFELGNFHHCLKDIDLCFKMNLPTDLKPKIYLRKAECFLYLNDEEAFKKYMSEGYNFLETENVKKKDKYMKKFDEVKNKERKNLSGDFSVILKEIPDFGDDENPSLAFASNKVRMNFTNEKGRHIIANSNIKRGDILFIEKAFAFAPIFKENKGLHLVKCYNCLKDLLSSVPCLSCTFCVYCDVTCRDISWSSCHQWECKGMEGNIWYELGIAFPAFRALVNGVTAGLEATSDPVHPEEDLKNFGDKQNNYKYFNRLLSNIDKTENIFPFTIMAATVVEYLRKYTDFFPWILAQPNYVNRDVTYLTQLVGGLIIKHIAQFSCNSGTIEHWMFSSSKLFFPDMLRTFACGIFPTVSIMNHSCRPNVANYFIGDTIVVSALEDINQNEEILNCYGIDYRVMKRAERQYSCKTRYFFDCKCSICVDPTKELELMNNYKCIVCGVVISEKDSLTITKCNSCGKTYLKEFFSRANAKTKTLLVEHGRYCLEILNKCLNLRKRFLCEPHKDLDDVYYALYLHFSCENDGESMFKYLNLWVDNEKRRIGSSSRVIGARLYEGALTIVYSVRNCPEKQHTDVRELMQNVESMLLEGRSILKLYYPPQIMNRVHNKVWSKTGYKAPSL